jgi:hypothetical protein
MLVKYMDTCSKNRLAQELLILREYFTAAGAVKTKA